MGVGRGHGGRAIVFAVGRQQLSARRKQIGAADVGRLGERQEGVFSPTRVVIVRQLRRLGGDHAGDDGLMATQRHPFGHPLLQDEHGRSRQQHRDSGQQRHAGDAALKAARRTLWQPKPDLPLAHVSRQIHYVAGRSRQQFGSNDRPLRL